MSEKSKCILCDAEANRSSVSGKDASFMECDVCGKYVLDHFFENAYADIPREKKAMLSAYTRERFELGGETPEIGDPDTLTGKIAEYEGKTLDEKLENLIWYLRKESPQFGDSVSLDAKTDYPITYSLSPQEFTKIRDLLFDKDFLEMPARGTGYKLTEEGFKLGTKLLEIKKKGSQ